jgi:creatinine amidohydrolase
MILHRLAEMTTENVREALANHQAVVLLPVGSVEPHGPHLPLGTDTQISVHACELAIVSLRSKGVTAYLAPSVPYGVTDFAKGFPGAIGVSKEALEHLLTDIVTRFLDDGFAHVCLVNNHLEPAHDAAVRAAIARIDAASVACPLTRRWARTLTDEFKKGECHAGRYETSLVLAYDASKSLPGDHRSLPAVSVSLSDGIKSGKDSFALMGMHEAYAGAPSEATIEEGVQSFEKLREMIETEVLEGLQRTVRTS